MRIAELANQIRGSHERAFFIVRAVGPFRGGKSGALDRAGYPLSIKRVHGSKSIEDE